MMRTQVQLPDELYREAKRVADERESTLTEIVRRGLEYMVQLYPPRESTRKWQLPHPRPLGPFKVSEEQWRELANEA